MRSAAFLPAALLVASLSLLGQEPGIRVFQDLSFGELAVDDRGGGVALTPEGTLVAYGAGLRPTTRMPVRDLRFTLTGPPHGSFRWGLDPPSPFLFGAGGSRIRVESFLTAPGAGEGVFDAQGQAQIRVGARLDVPAGTPAGLYATRLARIVVQSLDPARPRQVVQEVSLMACLRTSLRIVALAPLEFGSLVPGASHGRFTVSPGGGVRSEPADGPRPFKGWPKAADFLITGAPGAAYSLELPHRLMLQGPGGALEVREFQCSVPLQSSLPAGGLRFQVGATLLVPPSQAPGVYRGVFTVSIDYL